MAWIELRVMLLPALWIGLLILVVWVLAGALVLALLRLLVSVAEILLVRVLLLTHGILRIEARPNLASQQTSLTGIGFHKGGTERGKDAAAPEIAEIRQIAEDSTSSPNAMVRACKLTSLRAGMGHSSIYGVGPLHLRQQTFQIAASSAGRCQYRTLLAPQILHA